LKRMRRSTGSHSLPGTFNMLGNCEKMKQRCKNGGCLMRCDLRINLKLALDLVTRPVQQMHEPPPSISLALRPPLNSSQEVRPVPLHRVESRCTATKKSAQYPTSRRVAMLGSLSRKWTQLLSCLELLIVPFFVQIRSQITDRRMDTDAVILQFNVLVNRIIRLFTSVKFRLVK